MPSRMYPTPAPRCQLISLARWKDTRQRTSKDPPDRHTHDLPHDPHELGQAQDEVLDGGPEQPEHEHSEHADGSPNTSLLDLLWVIFHVLRGVLDGLDKGLNER